MVFHSAMHSTQSSHFSLASHAREARRPENRAVLYPLKAVLLRSCLVGVHYTGKTAKKVAESATLNGRASSPTSQHGGGAAELRFGLTSRSTAATMRLSACRLGEAI